MGDTNEISKGCLTHYDNRHIQVRLDFLGLCAYDKDLFDEKRKEEPNQECMAKILRLFETLTDHARTGWQLKAINAKEKGLTIPQEPKEYRFELTNGAIISLIYNTFGESTVRNSLDYLIHLGYIGRYQEKKNSIPVYWLNTQKIQPLLKEQAENELSGFEITPQTPKGLKSHPKRPKSNPSPTISNPKPPKSDTSGFESTDNNISNNKDNITKKERNERESSPNTLDTHTIVSSDTAHAEYPLITFAHCLSYLQEQGVAPRGEDAVQVMVQARTLYAHKHPRYEYRARPGLSEHPDDQLPSKQNEQVFTNDEPQGDTHAAADSGHPHRDSALPAPGGDSDHTAVDDGQVATPKTGPVLEAQEEINEKGQTDDGNQSRASSSHPDGSGQHMRVSGNSGSRDLGQAHQETLTQIPPTSMPAQSLSSPQAEQAASGARARTRKPAQPKAETPKSSPVEPPADMAWGTRKCLLWFDYWRGGILIGKWKLMQASTCAKGLAEQFDEQTVIQARDDMEADPYYAAKGGCDVCDVANNIHKYLKRRERQHLQLVAAIPTPAPLPRIATKEELRRIPV